MNEEVNKITYEVTTSSTNGQWQATAVGTYTGDLGINGITFEYSSDIKRREAQATMSAKAHIEHHFSKLLRPIVNEEVGL